MPSEMLTQITYRAIADYGYRLLLSGNEDDIIRRFHLSDEEARLLKSEIVPELKKLPDAVDPDRVTAFQATFDDILRRLVNKS